jgi:hypothetical protein
MPPDILELDVDYEDFHIDPDTQKVQAVDSKHYASH